MLLITSEWPPAQLMIMRVSKLQMTELPSSAEMLSDDVSSKETGDACEDMQAGSSVDRAVTVKPLSVFRIWVTSVSLRN